jgi:glycosyltransferase involved in cell wall biosynthesis
MTGITAHMVVKNEDIFVRYAINSILPYVDHFLITDTGSTDATLKRITSISSPKIKLQQTKCHTPASIVAVRSEQLQATKSQWIWQIDGDEVYPAKTCQEIVNHLDPNLAGVMVRRFDSLGDIYHYQPDERVGGYHLFGRLRHINLRLINRQLAGLHLRGHYPQEGFYDGQGKALISYPQSRFYLTRNGYLHTTYLKRSTTGSSLKTTLHRHKYKIEWGKKLPLKDIPEEFSLASNSEAVKKRSLVYNLAALIITPLKMLKRTVIK